jgi:hypothetical protein
MGVRAHCMGAAVLSPVAARTLAGARVGVR